MPMPLKTLFLNPPSFENFDGGASSRWPATREIESYWYPVWLSYPAGMLEGSRLLDAPPHHVSAEETIKNLQRLRIPGAVHFHCGLGGRSEAGREAIKTWRVRIVRELQRRPEKTLAKKAARKPAKAKAREGCACQCEAHPERVRCAHRGSAARAPAAVHAPLQTGPAEIAVRGHAHVLDKEAGADIGIVHGEGGPKVIESVKKLPELRKQGHHIRQREGRVRLQQLRTRHRGERHGLGPGVEGVRRGPEEREGKDRRPDQVHEAQQGPRHRDRHVQQGHKGSEAALEEAGAALQDEEVAQEGEHSELEREELPGRASGAQQGGELPRASGQHQGERRAALQEVRQEQPDKGQAHRDRGQRGPVRDLQAGGHAEDARRDLADIRSCRRRR